MDQSNNNLQPERLTRKERRELERQRPKEDREKEEKSKNVRKIIRRSIVAIVVVAFIAGIGWLIASSPKLPNLPPTSAQGHMESNPPAHITDKSIPDPIQRHMLEHADGKGKPGIIIQYNCKKYTCETDLIQKLTDLVKQYPDNVYLAPSDYDGKIILTKSGSIKILESFDEKIIKDFIGS